MDRDEAAALQFLDSRIAPRISQKEPAPCDLRALNPYLSWDWVLQEFVTDDSVDRLSGGGAGVQAPGWAVRPAQRDWKA